MAFVSIHWPVWMCCRELYTGWVLRFSRPLTLTSSQIDLETVHLTRSNRGIGQPDLIFKLHVEFRPKTDSIEVDNIITFLFWVSIMKDLYNLIGLKPQYIIKTQVHSTHNNVIVHLHGKAQCQLSWHTDEQHCYVLEWSRNVKAYLDNTASALLVMIFHSKQARLLWDPSWQMGSCGRHSSQEEEENHGHSWDHQCGAFGTEQHSTFHQTRR